MSLGFGPNVILLFKTDCGSGPALKKNFSRGYLLCTGVQKLLPYRKKACFFRSFFGWGGGGGLPAVTTRAGRNTVATLQFPQIIS